MSEQENLQLMQEAYRLFASGDIPNLMETYADDIELIVPGPPGVIPISGRYQGKEELMHFFHKVNENFQIKLFEPLEMIIKGDRVAVLGHYQNIVKATGQSVTVEWVHVFQLQDGKIKKFQIYEDTATLAAAFSKSVVGHL